MSKRGKIIKRIRGSPFAFFLGKKIVFLLVTIFIAMNFIFIFPRLMPSNPVDLMIARTGGIDPSTVGTGASSPGGYTYITVLREIYTEKFGLNEPLHVQYFVFWRRFVTMDFGLSYWRYPQSVSSLVADALPWTIALVLPVIPIGFIIGNWIGSRAAYRRGRLDNALYYISMYLSRAPYYWFALIFILIFGVKLGWFPIHGAYSAQWICPALSLDWFLDALWHYSLPFLSLVGLGIGGWAVGMRAMTLYEMESDYIHYSKQLGFSNKKLRGYAERNAILPNFTGISLILSGLIGQTLLVEIVFGYPGLGTLFFHAVFAQDYPLIEAGFIITILIVIVGNFVIDLLYGKIDPRIATGYVGGK